MRYDILLPMVITSMMEKNRTESILKYCIVCIRTTRSSLRAACAGGPPRCGRRSESMPSSPGNSQSSPAKSTIGALLIGAGSRHTVQYTSPNSTSGTLHGLQPCNVERIGQGRAALPPGDAPTCGSDMVRWTVALMSFHLHTIREAAPIHSRATFWPRHV